MAELHASIIKNFGYVTHKIKKEKSYFIFETPEGLKKICKTTDTEKQILFQHTVKEHVAKNGYPWVDRFSLSASNQPFVNFGGENYVMSSFSRGRETDFGNWPDVEQAMGAAALFHSCARNVPLENVKPGIPLQEFFRKQSTELNAIARRVRRQPRLSDFDVLFIKNMDFYTEQINSTVSGFDKTDYTAWLETARAEGHICHNALKEESLILSGRQTFIGFFGDTAVDVQLNDVAALIRRYVQRSGAEAVPVTQLLEAYGRVCPLPGPALDILYVLLQFPWNFMKIVNQYYSKKRSWTPNAMANRMLAVVSEKDFYAGYIRGLAK
jgi:CotS family spore coat protein